MPHQDAKKLTPAHRARPSARRDKGTAYLLQQSLGCITGEKHYKMLSLYLAFCSPLFRHLFVS
jgi:hypothetical protein